MFTLLLVAVFSWLDMWMSVHLLSSIPEIIQQYNTIMTKLVKMTLSTITVSYMYHVSLTRMFGCGSVSSVST